MNTVAPTVEHPYQCIIEACTKLDEGLLWKMMHEKSEVTLDDRTTSVLLTRFLLIAGIYVNFAEKASLTSKSIKRSVLYYRWWLGKHQGKFRYLHVQYAAKGWGSRKDLYIWTDIGMRIRWQVVVIILGLNVDPRSIKIETDAIRQTQ